MRYGLIGERLGHSFSVEIHAMIADYTYELCELSREEFDSFMKAADFLGINVTMPYKRDVIPYLYEIDEGAKSIGAVNAIVKRDGRLYGYNTDFYGMGCIIKKMGVSPAGKKCVILGTGGTSNTAEAVLKSLGAGEILKVSRNPSGEEISYARLYEAHLDASLIINTTPVGMYPEISPSPIDLSKFSSLEAVVDAIYNPLKTSLILQAEKLNIPAAGGLYMLVAQGVRASEIFLDIKYPENTIDECYNSLISKKQSIVLTGMPASGKSTVGRLLSERLSRDLYDTDAEIEKTAGMTIPEIFNRYGEEHFRALEADLIREISKKSGIIISTGGGAVLRRENVEALRHNGKIFFIDRPPEKLIPTIDRPLSSDKEAIMRRYGERIGIYTSTADEIIDADKEPCEVMESIIKRT